MEQGAPVKRRWSLIFTLIGVVLWSQPGISAKVELFTDKEGTLHISNESQAEPGKPGGVQAPAPIGTAPPPQIIPPSTPPSPVPPPQLIPPPVEPPEMPDSEGPPAAPESGGQTHPAPAVPPPHVAPGQQE